jgi:hypothetical protein
MKKILFLLFLVTTLSSSFAQKNAAPKDEKPTKDETMDWIAGKMKDYLAEPRIFLSYSKGLFAYKKLDTGDIYCTTTIDLNKLTGMTNEYASDFYVSGKALLHRACPGAGYDPSGTDYENLSISGLNYNEYSEPFNFKTDNTLVERLRKAFTTLMEYNTPKKIGKRKILKYKYLLAKAL